MTKPLISEQNNGENEGGSSCWTDAVPVGRITELSGRGAVSRTTLAVSLIVEAQSEGEPCAWVQPKGVPDLYAPDLLDAGVQLDQLAIVSVPPLMGEVLKAAELLLRGGIGVVVVDVTDAKARVPMRALSRLQGLARQHQSRVVFLSHDAEEAIGSLVGLRVVPDRVRASTGFVVEPRTVRDKVCQGAIDPHAFAAPPDASLMDRVVTLDNPQRTEKAPVRVALAS